MKTSVENQNVFSNISVRIMNQKRVLRLLHRVGSMTQLDIKNELKLSGPTVTQILQFFKEAGILADGEEIPSSGGRKPKPIVFCYDAFHAVGVEIRRHHVNIRVMNLRGQVVSGAVHRLLFENSDQYWKEVNRLVRGEIDECSAARGILGIGIAFPGELSPAGDRVVRATVFGLEEFPITDIQKNFDYPVHVEYGANAAGFGTVWRDENLQDAIYIIVTDNGVAGSIILDKKIYRGRNGKAGAFGHIVLDPDGEACFCGARGCWSAFCSAGKLTGSDEPNLGMFFEKLKSGDEECEKRWEEYLSRFAQALANIRLSFDTDIIIGGEIAMYMGPWLDRLKEKVASYPALKGDALNISVDNSDSRPMAVGAALVLVEEFLNNDLDGYRFDELVD